MDQLEVLKKKWQESEQEFPKFTSKEIYPMLLRKSSSILKWIVVISICELVFWTVLAFFIPESSKEFNNQMGLETIFKWINVFNYAVVIGFIVLFWRNYRKIQVTQSVKTLMGNILRARKTVHYFVFYNIGMAIALLAGINLYYYYNKEHLYDILKNDDIYGAIPAETFTTSFFLFQFVAGVLLIGFLILFYWLIYGLLLRRLKRNYRELKQIEV